MGIYFTTIDRKSATISLKTSTYSGSTSVSILIAIRIARSSISLNDTSVDGEGYTAAFIRATYSG